MLQNVSFILISLGKFSVKHALDVNISIYRSNLSFMISISAGYLQLFLHHLTWMTFHKISQNQCQNLQHRHCSFNFDFERQMITLAGPPMRLHGFICLIIDIY